MRCSDIKKTQFVGTLLVVDPGLFDRVSGINQIDEVDSLDGTPVLHVEARDDTGLEHRGLDSDQS